MAQRPDGSYLVTEEYTTRVTVIPADGGVPTLLASVPGGYDVEVGADGDVYVGSYVSDSVVRVPAAGGAPTTVASDVATPYGLVAARSAVPQEITFTSAAPEDATVGDTYIPTATGGGSGNAVTFSVADSAADVCSIDAESGVVTFDAPGTCTVTADQAGGTVDDVEYADAAQATQDADAAQATQDVTVSVPQLFITGQVSSDAPANEAGWYRTPATITYTCGGGTAPLVCPDPVCRANTQSDFRAFAKVTDAEGRVARTRTPLMVDTTSPRLSITGQASGPYERSARPIGCTATDKHSGVDDACTVTYSRVLRGPGGTAVRRWTASATDVAGNTTTVSRTFRVKGAAPAAGTTSGPLGRADG